MTGRRHEIPTHLGVEEKVLPGLTARQFAYLLLAATGAYAVWQQWAGPPEAIRLGLAAALLGAGVALAFGRRHGRGLDAWLPVLLRYATSCRRSVWHPGPPDPAAWEPAPSPWAELAPRLGWRATPAAASAAVPAGPDAAGAAGTAAPNEPDPPPAERRPPSAQAARVRLEAVAGGTLRLGDGRQRAVLRVDGLQLRLRDAGEQEAVLAAFAAFLNGLAFPVQFLTRILPYDGDAYLERLERAARRGAGALAAVARDHAALVRRLVRDGALLERRFYLVVPAPDLPPSGAAPPDGRRRRAAGAPSARLPVGLLGARFGGRHGGSGGQRRPGSGDGEPTGMGTAEPDTARRVLAARCAEVAGGLARSGLTAHRLDDGELTDLQYACWCPELARRQRLRPDPAAHTVLVVRGPNRGRTGSAAESAPEPERWEEVAG